MGSIIVTLFYIAVSLLLIFSIWSAINAYKNRPTKGQLRVAGISAAFLIWIELIFFLVIGEAAFSLFSLTAGLPIWVDFVVFLTMLLVISIIIGKLATQKKFNKERFKKLVLIPLGVAGFVGAASVPGIKIATIAIKNGTLDFTHLGVYFPLKSTGTITSPPTSIVSMPPIPGIIGGFAEQISIKILELKGYEILPSQNASGQGIDHLAVKYIKSTAGKPIINEVRIVETKANNQPLKPPQMEEGWIADRLEELYLKNKDNELGVLYFKIFQEWNRSGHGIVKTELWRQDVDKNILTIQSLSYQKGKLTKSNASAETPIVTSNQMREIKCKYEKMCADEI